MIHTFGIPMGFLHQPLDEVRDYFGDGTALYFSWLETYTKALMALAPLGLVTMFTQWTTDGGVDSNELTLYYSVMLSVWSVIFLSVWKRRESEHAFLWGSEGYEKAKQPRKQFKGVTKVNKETHREELVHDPNPLPRLIIKTLSSVVILGAIVVTAGLAFAAMGLKFRAPKECSAILKKDELDCEDWVINAPADVNGTAVDPANYTVTASADFDALCCYDVENSEIDAALYAVAPKLKWKIISGACNFFVIQFMGASYEAVAEYLNNKENFRTQTEYNDGIIVKNFVFQFFNNYFVLFYIAYLRQIEFMGSKKECEKSCLGELQAQMMIVFTAKTFGLQLVELAKPFVAQLIGTTLELKRQQKMVGNMLTGAADGLTSVIPGANASGEDDNDGLQKEAQENADAREQYQENRSSEIDKDKLARMGIYEQQTHMVNYEKKGTFDDFNEMAIQYGYVALFSPVFPLAAFFAFLNNVTEIRGDAWKLCVGFQRPNCRPAEDIGSWYTVLNVIGFIAVITNATMIAFVGSQIAQQDDIQVDWMNGLVADQMEEEGTLQNPVYGIMMRIRVAPLWIYAVMVEHGVFISRVCILVFFPTQPAWIGAAKDVKKFRLNNMKKEADERQKRLEAEHSLEHMVYMKDLHGKSSTFGRRPRKPKQTGKSRFGKKNKKKAKELEKEEKPKDLEFINPLSDVNEVSLERR